MSQRSDAEPPTSSTSVDDGVMAEATILLARLPPPARRRLDQAAALARARRVPLYLVGGSVRDLILGRSAPDLDLVIEGDAIAFAKVLARTLGGIVQSHPEFLTAVVTDSAGVIDLASARQEIYPRAAALPEVRPADLSRDLVRRDFAVNAMAIELHGELPRLLDPLGGLADLQAARLRVLHEGSFVDDPTRILRGVRFEQRLGFRFDPQTERLAREAVAAGGLNELSGSRLRDELARLVEEPAPERGIRRLAELGVLGAIHPALGWGSDEQGRWQEVEQAGAVLAFSARLSRFRLILLVLVESLERREREAVAERLLLAGAERDLLVNGPDAVAAAREALGAARLPHQVAEALDTLEAEEQVLLLSGTDAGAAWAREAHSAISQVTLAVRGDDLLAAGVAPGPALGEALRATRRARIDGVIGPEEELGFALAWLQGSNADGVTPAPLRRSRR